MADSTAPERGAALVEAAAVARAELGRAVVELGSGFVERVLVESVLVESVLGGLAADVMLGAVELEVACVLPVGASVGPRVVAAPEQPQSSATAAR